MTVRKEQMTWEAYKAFEECTIRDGEKYKDFMGRFRAEWERLQHRSDAPVMINKLLSMKLQMAAKIDTWMQMAIETAIRAEEESVFEDTVEAIRALHEGQMHGEEGRREE